MRPLLALGLLTQLACWSEQRFTDACLAAGHCVVDDAGTGGGGGETGGGGGATGGGGGVTGGGGGVTGGGGGTTGGGGGVTGGGGGATGGGGGVLPGDGGPTWTEVSTELFDVTPGLDAGFVLEFAPIVGPGGGWVGGVLTPQGDVICIPYQGTGALRITPTRQVTLIPVPAQGWEGAVLLGDGRILGLPYEAPTLLSISGQGVAQLDAGLPRAGALDYPYFEGGVITLSEKVLLAPGRGIAPGVFDTATGVLSLLDGGFPDLSPTGGENYGGAVLLPDGESAVLVPRAAQQLMHVTPTGAQLLGPNDLQGHAGGVLLPDGRVVMLPRETGEFIVWNGTTMMTTRGLPSRGYFSGAWSTNGYAYAVQASPPGAVASVAIIDRDGGVSEIELPDSGVFQNSHYGLVSMADGTLVGCPFDSDDVLFLVPVSRRPVSLRTMTSPWLNKW